MSFLSAKAQKLVPYVAGEQPQDKLYIKLNTNENPYGPSPKVAEVLSSFDLERLRLYPEPNAKPLAQAIARVKGVGCENVFVGNGSDEVLAFCFSAFLEKKTVAFADMTYSFYPVYAQMFDAKTVIVPLKSDLTQDTEAYLRVKADAIVIANPNAPTSIAMPLSDLKKIADADQNRLLIVDEAYVDFGGESAVSLTKARKNVLVVQTFSKSYSLAGVRCGYAIGDATLIDGLRRVKDSFNNYTVTMLTQAIAEVAILDEAYQKKCVADVVKTRDSARAELVKAGFDVPQSSTNFLFIKIKNAKDAYQRLKDEGILVRYFSSIPDRLRVTIGTKAETEHFVKKLKEITSSKG